MTHRRRERVPGGDAAHSRPDDYDGYRWLLERSDPRLWLHGHVPPASVDGWRVVHDGTDVVNVTGAVLVEIQPPGTAATRTLSAA